MKKEKPEKREKPVKCIRYGVLTIAEKPFNEIHKKAFVKSVIANDRSVVIEYTSKNGKNRGTMELYDKKLFEEKAKKLQPLQYPHK